MKTINDIIIQSSDDISMPRKDKTFDSPHSIKFSDDLFLSQWGKQFGSAIRKLSNE